MRGHRSGRMTAHIGIAALALLLAGCSGIREQFGLTKTAPDEFTVVKKAPLVLPPDLTLRPPRPGAPRPQESTPGQAARTALLLDSGKGGQSAAPGSGDGTAGESALLKLAGSDKANPDIRRLVDKETAVLQEKSQSFTNLLIFWQDPPAPGQVIDASKEATRLRENSATGKPPTAGATPIIERRKRGFLEGIF